MGEIHSGYQGIFDGRLQPGKKPALLVIDVIKAYVDPHSPLFTPNAVMTLDSISSVIRFVRNEGHLIVHTRVEYQQPQCADGGLFVDKVPALKNLVPGAHWSQYAEESVSPQRDLAHTSAELSLEIIKQFPSAFFRTELSAVLEKFGCDTVFIVGFSTSGCVRATVLDALQHGFRPFVISDCVSDRSLEAHRVNLLDIQSKYGEVVTREEALRIYRSMMARSVP